MTYELSLLASRSQRADPVTTQFDATLIEPLPVGILFTLVTAGVVSRKRREERGVIA